MTTFDSLIRLLGEAKAEAERIGPAASPIAHRLEQSLAQALSLAETGGRPDEGKRPEQLSSANDG